MGDKSRLQHVVDKYRLADATNVEMEHDGRKLGLGRIMAEDCLQEFVRRDPSGNGKYLDWMLFIAGGGQVLMDRTLGLWHDQGPSDTDSLRAQCREDFIQERMSGYTDDQGNYVPPLTDRKQVERLWLEFEERSFHEFVMGDQDVASEEGFGFYRHWPGRDKRYLKIVNAVKLWHDAIPKLRALNEAGSTRIELDIYAGWKPNSFSQKGAVYKNLEDLLRPLSAVRRNRVRRDTRHEIIFENERVLAVCPLTVGASLYFGCRKWCTSNPTEFERSFDSNQVLASNWANYTRRGVLVYMNWKCPMPPWLSKIGMHIEHGQLRCLRPVDATYIDVKNQPGGVKLREIVERITNEARRYLHPVVSEDADLCYYKRKPGTKAWTDETEAHAVVESLNAAACAVAAWAKSFDTSKIVVDYTTDLSEAELVDKV